MTSSDDESIKLSIDKLSFSGYYDDKMIRFLERRIEFSKTRSKSPMYDTNVKLFNQIFMQFDTNTSKRIFRIEFNPTKLKEKYAYLAREILLSYALDYTLTRIDVAVDFYDDMSEYAVRKLYPVKKTLYIDESGSLETLYLGSPKSRNKLRFYNKKVQMLEKEKEALIDLPNHWWRLEHQLRYNANISEFFKNIVIYSKQISKKLSDKDYILLYTYLNDATFYNRCSRHYREKVKELLKLKAKPYKYTLSEIIAENIRILADLYNFYKIEMR